MTEPEKLRSTCDCGRRVRVLWSGPLSADSRPVLLVCGYHPDRRCGFQQVIPEENVDQMLNDHETSFHSLSADTFPMTVEYWVAGADRRGAPSEQYRVDGPGVLEVPGLGPGTWCRVTLGTGEVIIEPPPGERVEDF
jgi:hypothetical protein